jgi:CTP synthase (UTP-ammonia lyase)
MTHPVPRLALVGDRSPTVQSHARIPRLLAALAERDGLPLDAYWIPTKDGLDGLDGYGGHGGFDGFDAVWLLPGSPYRSEAGALAAVRAAREHGIPFLGTCAGFQHALIEYARGVCGLTGARHGENDPGAPNPMIGPLACSLVGHEGEVRIAPGSLAERVLGAERSVERYHCAYGALNPRYEDTLRDHGLAFTGTDADGTIRIAELPGHPFFLATLFQPELAGDGSRPHPIIRALAAAAARHAAAAADPAADPALPGGGRTAAGSRG